MARPVTGDRDVAVVSAMRRETVLRLPDSGFTTTLKGAGLSAEPLDALTGTVTRIAIRNATGDLLGALSGMAWKAARLFTAPERGYTGDDGRALGTL